MSANQWFQQNKHILFQLVVLFVMIVSYIPQQVIICRVRDSSSLDPVFLLFAVCGCLFQVTNVVGSHWDKLFVTKDMEALLKSLVVFSQAIMLTIIGSLYFVHFPKAKQQSKQHAISKYCLLAYAVTLPLSCVLSLGFRYFSQQATFALYSDINGYLNALCTSLQYIPQVLHTFRTKDTTSISMLTLSIQIPGSIVLIISMAMGDGTVSNWISYLLGCIFQTILLGLCIYYKRYVQKMSTPAMKADL